MSIQAVAWALKQNGGYGPKFVLVALANYADDQGVCWPSLKSLANDTGVSRRSIIRHLNNLCDRGLLSKEARLRPDGGCTTNVYKLRMGGDNITSPGGDTRDTGVVTHGVTPKGTSLEPSLSSVPTEPPPAASLECEDLRTVIFGRCLAILMARGMQEPRGRTLLGKLRKHHEDGEIVDAFARLEREAVVDPAPWLLKVLPAARPLADIVAEAKRKEGYIDDV